MAPKIKYNQDNEILSLRFSAKKSVDSDIQGNVVIDYDAKGEIVNIDIMKINLDNFVARKEFKRLGVKTKQAA